MIDRRPTDLELANALRARLPAVARTDLRELVANEVASTPQQRAWPSLLGALTDADPFVRRRSLLLAALALMTMALAGAAAAGAWRLWQRSDVIPGAHGQFAFVRGGDVYLAMADGGEALLVAHVDGSELSDPQWSADGQYLALQTPEPAVLVLDFRTEDLRRLSAGRLAAWSPVAATLAYYTPAGQIALFDVERGDGRVLVEPPPGSEGYPGYDDTLAWSPDGRQLAITASAVDGPMRLVLIDATTGAMTTVATSSEPPCCAFRPSWAPDSSRIAYSIDHERGGPKGSWITDVDGTGSVEIRDPDGTATDPVWSPDGAWIGYHVTRSAEGGLRSDRVILVRPDGSDRRLVADISHEPGGRSRALDRVVGWSDDSTAIAYTVVVDGDPGEFPRRELHLVSVADGADRVLPALTDGRDVAWAVPRVGLPTGVQPPPVRQLVAAEPAAGEPVRPDASWGGLAFRIGGEGEGDCHVAVLRFPDTLVELPQPFGPPPTEPPPAPPPAPGASPPPRPAAEYCEFSFPPDGSAFSLTSQANQSFVIVRSDGTPLSGPFAWYEVPGWSPGSDWIVTSDCTDAGACSEARAMIMRPDGSDRRSLPGSPTWSRNEQVMAVQAGDGDLLVGRGDGTKLRSVGTFPLPVGWSPDASTFLFVRDGNAWLAHADGSEDRNLTGFELGGVTGAWWSPDGRWIAVLQGTTMWTFSPDGSIQHRLGSGLGPADASWEWAPAWSPDSAWLAIEHADPTGAVGSGAQEVTLIHAGDWRAVRLTNAWQPVWSKDGRHLAIMSDDDDGYLADVMNADGTGRTTVARDLAYPPIAWVP